MRVASVAAVVLAFVLSACGAGLSPVPGHGGPAYYELESSHFVLRTDLPQAQANEELQQMEQLLHAFLSVGWQTSGELPSRLLVIMFRNPEDIDEFAPGFEGFSVHGAFPTRYVVVPGPADPHGMLTLQHELAHDIAFLAMPHQPRWFAEGIACYYETAELGPNGNFAMGVPNMDRARPILDDHIMPVSTLFAEQAATTSLRFYATAWLLVHDLMTRHSDAFNQYQSALAAGQPFDRAWSLAFPGLTPEALDHELHVYLRNNQFDVLDAKVPSTPVTIAMRTMSDADVYVMRAQLYASCMGCDNAATQSHYNSELALLADPDNVDANLFDAATLTDTAQQLVRFRKIARAHPESWSAWLYLARALTITIDAANSRDPVLSDECDAAIAKATALAPWSALPLTLKADAALRAGKSEEALQAAERALVREPLNLQAAFIEAAALRALRRCDELSRVSERILGMPDVQLSETARTQLSQWTVGCVPAPTAASAAL